MSGAETAFDLAVKVVGGFLVLLAFKAKIWPPVIACLRDKIIKPHDDLNRRCDEFETAQETLEIGVLAILHDRVYQACKYHIDNGEIDVDDLKNLEHLYSAYAAMGGNGTCKHLYERVCALEFTTD